MTLAEQRIHPAQHISERHGHGVERAVHGLRESCERHVSPCFIRRRASLFSTASFIDSVEDCKHHGE